MRGHYMDTQSFWKWPQGFIEVGATHTNCSRNILKAATTVWPNVTLHCSSRLKPAAGKRGARPAALGQLSSRWDLYRKTTAPGPGAGNYAVIRLHPGTDVRFTRIRISGDCQKCETFCQEQIVALLTCDIYKIAVASSWNLHWVLFTVPLHKANSDCFNHLQSSWKWLAWQLFMTHIPGIPSETD